MALAKNTVFKVNTVAVTGVTSISWSGRVFATEDITNHDAATPVKMAQTTIADNGKVSLILSPYDKGNTQHALLRSLNISGASAAFVMVQVNSGETATFNGYVSSFSWDTPVLGILKAKVDILVNGEMTIT